MQKVTSDKWTFIYRSRQDSNLRGETPMDFKSIALTTRPRLPSQHDNHGNAKAMDFKTL